MKTSTTTWRSMFLVAILGWLWTHPALASTPDLILTVGSDPECDYSTVEAAYAAIPNHPETVVAELRLKKENLRRTHLLIDDLAARPAGFRLQIRGGYEICGGTATSGLTYLLGTGQSPIVQISAGRARRPGESPEIDRTIEIERVLIGGNDVTRATEPISGAGLHATAGTVILRTVNFANLTSRGHGGAVYLANDLDSWRPHLVLESVKFGNTFAHGVNPGEEAAGGAVYCQANPSLGRIRISGSVAAINQTKAEVQSTDGGARGGFAFFDHCEAHLEMELEDSRLTEAIAMDQPATGGFIHARGRSDVELTGTFTIRQPVARSTGGALGGAFYVEGGSRVVAQAVRSQDPEAPGGVGGFLYATGPGTAVLIGCDAAGGCPAGQAPPSLIENARAFAGGAFGLENNAFLEASGMVLAAPSAETTGAAAYLATGAVAKISGSRVTGGRADIPSVASLFEARSGALQYLERVTTAENDGVHHLFGGDGLTVPRISSSILAESPDGPEILGPSLTTAETDGCVVSSTDRGLPPATGWTISSEPSQIGFDVQADVPYRLAEDSVARDLCPPARAIDLDGEAVGFELSRSPTPVDAGADEWMPSRRVCFDVDRLLDAAEHQFTGRVPGPGFVGDVNLVTQTAAGENSYSLYLSARGITHEMDHDDTFDEATTVFDDEAELAAGSNLYARLPDESLSVFDDSPLAGTTWTLSVVTTDDGYDEPALLERWCLDITVSSTTRSIFADGFETGNTSRWSAP